MLKNKFLFIFSLILCLLITGCNKTIDTPDDNKDDDQIGTISFNTSAKKESSDSGDYILVTFDIDNSNYRVDLKDDSIIYISYDEAFTNVLTNKASENDNITKTNNGYQLVIVDDGIHDYLYVKLEVEDIANNKLLSDSFKIDVLELLGERIDVNKPDFSAVINYLDNYLADIGEIKASISLPTNYEGFSISWNEDDFASIDGLSSDGTYKRPYKTSLISLKATLSKDDYDEKYEKKITIIGFKDLDNGIASGYVYRSYDALTDEFFDTMDIIYCAFILLNEDGSIQANSRTISNITTYVLPKAHQEGCYVVPSIGGGGSTPAATFSTIAKDATKRQKLAEELVKLVNQYGFDGIDIDWEKPADANEGKNFTLLMAEIHTAIKANNPNHLVTGAITGGKYQPPCYDLTNSGKYLDYINVMTYGMTYSNGQYHTALYKSSTYNDQVNKVGMTGATCSIDESVTIFNSYNIPNSKLIFGLAFYGVKQVLTNGKWSKESSVFYTNIKNELLESGEYKYVYDEKAGVAYLLSNDGKTFINYDDPTSIIAKCNYVLANKCAGVMYWENGCDLTGDLVKAIKDGLKK